jgi:hypothetical protein
MKKVLPFTFLIRSVILLGFFFLLLNIAKLQAQENNEDNALIATSIDNLPDKKYSLCLIPLEGNHVNSAKCQKTDVQSTHLLPGQKLVVTLNKQWLFYRHEGKPTLGTNYNIQSGIKVDDWDGWENWMLDRVPLEWKGSISHDFYNNYSYQAGNESGKVTLSFISQTYPRYYSSLHIIID